MDHSFESAFERLEQILDIMNKGNSTLEDSLKLFEEADGLIRLCSKWLNSAEQKVAILIKNRGIEVSLDEEGKPQVVPYTNSRKCGI